MTKLEEKIENLTKDLHKIAKIWNKKMIINGSYTILCLQESINIAIELQEENKKLNKKLEIIGRSSKSFYDRFGRENENN